MFIFGLINPTNHIHDRKIKNVIRRIYNPNDQVLVSERHRARLLFQKINQLNDDSKKERKKLLYELLENAGKGLWVEPPFYCDYGYNIHTGKNVFFNFNCVILDVMKVEIGDHVLIGPDVQIYTATHPLDAKTRNSWLEYAKPVTIGDDVWIGGGAIIYPGVSIGNGAVIAAGAVVTKSVPANVVMGGNPAKILKEIDNSDN